ncbi:MAG TPA: galactose-1-phosphate uridylyltransferase [Pirellulaceae bacterium]|nr:galactose-1-phosphate uridylyltransferase [Pirellulaceae bacterium]
MSLLRFDPTTSDWVIFSPSRSLRPHDRPAKVGPGDDLTAAAKCPFCPGNEAFTPPEIYSLRSPADPTHWQVRVFPNKFPALRIEENPRREADGHMFQFMGGCGAHEVIVESPDHRLFLAQQPLDQVERVLRTLQLRYQDLMRDRRVQTVIIFKNHGAEAGTSLAHPHWQLIATPVVPRLLRVKHFEASEYFDRTGSCLYAVIREQELEAGKRILASNEDYVAFMPYASHAPFETWIVPRSPPPSFTQVRPERLRTLAELLKKVLLELHTALDNPAFNLTIDNVPRGDEDKEYFLWHVRILPRLTTPAGFELGSGMAINTVLPEDAVAFLTEVAVVENGKTKTAAA